MIRRYLLSTVLITGCFWGASAAKAQEVSMPTSGWLVGPSVVDKDPQMNEDEVPCIMANQFANGAFLRISIVQDKVVAMAVTKTDFAENLTGDDNVTLQIDTGADSGKVLDLKARPLNNDTFLISLSDQDLDVQTLANTQQITMTVGGFDMRFSSYGITDGLLRARQCQGVSGVVVPRQNDPNMRTQRNVPRTDNAPKKVRDPELSNKMDEAFSIDMQVTPATSSVQLQDGDRKPGVHVISKRLANHWTQPLPEEAQEEAPIASPQIASAPAAVSDTALSPMPQIAATTPIPQQVSPEILPEPTASYNWQSVRGASLRETLFNWSRNINAQLIWRSSKQPVVETSKDYSGTYEVAVSQILEDFNGKGFDFKATIYPDFSTGNIILLVE